VPSTYKSFLHIAIEWNKVFCRNQKSLTNENFFSFLATQSWTFLRSKKFKASLALSLLYQYNLPFLMAKYLFSQAFVNPALFFSKYPSSAFNPSLLLAFSFSSGFSSLTTSSIFSSSSSTSIHWNLALLFKKQFLYLRLEFHRRLHHLLVSQPRSFGTSQIVLFHLGLSPPYSLTKSTGNIRFR